MKKFLCILVVLFSLSSLHASVIAWAIAIGAVEQLVEVYKRLPDAEYILTICDKNNTECVYAGFKSCNETRMRARTALEQGASMVTIGSVHSTVNSACRDKAYYPKDKDSLF